ncbi:MAG TPA: response regulator [Bacteroidales bacterium]|jgi:CheY-like chemotaxis protein|nr:response regulator [Bacteroidales bacterium]
MKTILIAEDEYSNYLYLEELLEGTNTRLIYASNGQEAVELCKVNQEIDLVLMDIRMPVLNGYLATKQIKAIRPALPVIAQTAYSLETDMKGLKSDFDDFIIKPINKAIFRQKIMKYLSL